MENRRASLKCSPLVYSCSIFHKSHPSMLSDRTWDILKFTSNKMFLKMFSFILKSFPHARVCSHVPLSDLNDFINYLIL